MPHWGDQSGALGIENKLICHFVSLKGRTAVPPYQSFGFYLDPYSLGVSPIQVQCFRAYPKSLNEMTSAGAATFSAPTGKHPKSTKSETENRD